MSTVLRYVAFVLMTTVSVLGGLFAAGYAFEHPGGWAAAGLVVVYGVPSALLAWYAATRPASAAGVLVLVTAVLSFLLVFNGTIGLVNRDDAGPVDSLAVLALGFALGFLGLHRPRLAGGLLLVAVLSQVAGAVVDLYVRGGDAAPLGAALGGSRGVVVPPLLLVGLLFCLADGAPSSADVPAHAAR
jgi:hypothetical protein